MLAFGDWGWTNSPQQQMCAEQMAAYAVSNHVRFDAAVLLGDNFYYGMTDGVEDPRWQIEFEQAYDSTVLAMPFYAALGNHDYEGKKAATELAYALRNPKSRWKMPGKWYRVEIPEENPLVSILVLDSNLDKLSREERTQQLRWLEQELERRRDAQWLLVAAHHPLYTSGQHGDSGKLQKQWGQLFQKYNVDFFLCGHDHDLQHLQMPGLHTSFILAGGGGAKIRPMKRDDRGPFSRSLHGFFVLKLEPGRATGEFISSQGELVHRFVRTRDGEIHILSTTGRDVPGEFRGF